MSLLKAPSGFGETGLPCNFVLLGAMAKQMQFAMIPAALGCSRRDQSFQKVEKRKVASNKQIARGFLEKRPKAAQMKPS